MQSVRGELSLAQRALDPTPLTNVAEARALFHNHVCAAKNDLHGKQVRTLLVLRYTQGVVIL